MGWSVVRETGLTYRQAARSFAGYTLIAPAGGDSAFLLDMDGRIVHRWRFSDLMPFCVRILPNGNLLAQGRDPAAVAPPFEFGQVPPPFSERVRMIGGSNGQLREVDWDGGVVWEYANEALHHDVVRLDNGNTIAAVFVEIPDEVQRKVRGGVKRPREKLPPMFGDDVIEIDRDGNEVWRVHTWQLFDPARDPICPLEPRWEWTHLNSLDVTSDGKVLISCRNNSRVAMIDRSSGEMTWKFGAPQIFHQHHATALPNGNVQIFDNGMHRIADMSYSRVVEVDPSTDEVVWEYVADQREQFFSGHISGAQRLPNGNVLICEGTVGRLFEVTARGETVWEWVSPFVHSIRNRPASWLFRAYRYGPDDAGLAGRELNPDAYADLNRLYGLA